MFWKGQRHKALEKAVGPAPWYWKTFPSFGDLNWHFHGAKGEFAFAVTLGRSPVDFLFSANIYSRIFRTVKGDLGVWYPNQDQVVKLFTFDLNTLQRFDADELLKGKKTEGFFCKAQPATQLSLSTSLPEGTHPLLIPDDFPDEMLIVAARPTSTADVAVCSVFVLNRGQRQVTVYPQTWFTAVKFDTGYQWIARVCRDPGSKRIIGDGVRIGSFMLDRSNQNLDRWL